MRMPDTRNLTLITRNLIDTLRGQLNQAQSAYLLPAFAMQSGVKLLLPALLAAAQRGADIKILTGDYLYITESAALRLLLDELPGAEIRIWQSRGQSFHAKAYLFEHPDQDGTLIVGSSNWSRAALTSGVEWSLLVRADGSIQGSEQFMHLFYDGRTVPLNRMTLAKYTADRASFHAVHPDLARTLTDQESASSMFEGIPRLEEDLVRQDAGIGGPLFPRPVQSEALAALADTRAEGYQKALVVLPTGLGKTYLAAFFARSFHRVLFVAHREEILQQSQRIFQAVMPGQRFSRYTGTAGALPEGGIFASVYTLAGEAHRHRFDAAAFDLLIVDEFHHAAARSYLHILKHFNSAFLLGLTATPDRTDGRDIFGLCDGNLAYQLSLPEAISREWLAPFWYLGVYDPSDYTQVRWRQTHYDEDDLLRLQTSQVHSDAVFRAWAAHHQTRTLGFCSSIRHAEFLSDEFARRGVRSAWVGASSGREHRRQTVEALAERRLDIVFSVDLFNEGLDIPSVDTVLMVRPTDSSIVFIQQLGRGLRLDRGKSHCTIIDLIGNYRRADNKLQWLGIRQPALWNRSGLRDLRADLPPMCRLDLELEVIDILARMARQQTPRKLLLLAAYERLKEELGRIPTYLEFHLQGGLSGRASVRQEYLTYVGLKNAAGDLTELQTGVWEQYRGWLEEVESTGMVKSYKIVLLNAMLLRGASHWPEPITPVSAAPFFHDFYMAEEYRKRIDFSDATTKKLWTYRESGVASLIRRNPMTQWNASSKGWVSWDGKAFTIEIPRSEAGSLAILHAWTQEIANYRLHVYFERKAHRS